LNNRRKHTAQLPAELTDITRVDSIKLSLEWRSPMPSPWMST